MPILDLDRRTGALSPTRTGFLAAVGVQAALRVVAGRRRRAGSVIAGGV